MILAMVRLEQVAALVLAAGLAIPSYVFFWSLAGGGGYARRGLEESSSTEERLLEDVERPKDHPEP